MTTFLDIDKGVGKAIKTRQEVLEEFDLKGQPIALWTQQNAFHPANVYAVLTGKTRGKRGEAHRIAVALGLKRGISPESVSGGNPIMT